MFKKLFSRAWSSSFGNLEKQFVKELNIAVGKVESILDVGCGFNSPVQLLSYRPKRLCGVDFHSPVIEQSKSKSIHDEYFKIPLLNINNKFRSNSFDCVLALDVIEHFKKNEALNLIQQIETIAREKIIIYTPNGFLPQSEEFGNPFQAHLSGWTVREMEALGYNVIGIEGLWFLRGYMAKIKWRPFRFWTAISLASQIITKKRPKIAFRLLCTKSLTKT